MAERKSQFDRDPFAILLGDRIEAIMTAKKISQADFANAIGRSPAYAWRLIDARQNVTLSLLGLICLALDVTPAHLFRGVKVPAGVGKPRAGSATPRHPSAPAPDETKAARRRSGASKATKDKAQSGS